MTNYYIEVLLLCRKIKNIDLILVFTARYIINIRKIPKAEELNRKKKYFGLTRDLNVNSDKTTVVVILEDKNRIHSPKNYFKK